MTKSDLEPGMIVELRNGYLYMIQKFINNLILVNETGWLYCDYDDTLKDKFNYGFDIMKIRKPDFAYTFIPKNWNRASVIWERKDIKLMTEEEKSLIRLLDEDCKWIVRDKDGEIVIFDNKPTKDEDYYRWWRQGNGDYFYLKGFDESAKFDFLSWEDEEPTNLDELRRMI